MGQPGWMWMETHLLRRKRIAGIISLLSLTRHSGNVRTVGESRDHRAHPFSRSALRRSTLAIVSEILKWKRCLRNRVCLCWDSENREAIRIFCFPKVICTLDMPIFSLWKREMGVKAHWACALIANTPSLCSTVLPKRRKCGQLKRIYS